MLASSRCQTAGALVLAAAAGLLPAQVPADEGKVLWVGSLSWSLTTTHECDLEWKDGNVELKKLASYREVSLARLTFRSEDPNLSDIEVTGTARYSWDHSHATWADGQQTADATIQLSCLQPVSNDDLSISEEDVPAEPGSYPTEVSVWLHTDCTASGTLTDFGRQSRMEASRSIHAFEKLTGTVTVKDDGSRVYDLSFRESLSVGNWFDPIEQKCPSQGKVVEAATLTLSEIYGYQVEIVYPEPDMLFPFGTWSDGELEIPAVAKAEPESYTDQIQPWNVDPIAGSELRIKPDPAVGPAVSFSFSRLPSDNQQFGRKTITADNADPVTVKVFFSKCKEDNPEGKNPNWFYYWRQGAVPGMEPFEYDPELEWHGTFNDETGKLYLGPEAANYDEPEILHLRGGGPLKFLFLPESNGVDTAARTVAHELMHKQIHDTWDHLIQQSHRQTPAGEWSDFDFDGIPDQVEELMEGQLGISWQDPDTHDLEEQIDEEYEEYGDQELLCYLAELGVTGIHDLDWAYQGKQAPAEAPRAEDCWQEGPP